MNPILNLKPQNVWKNFYELTQVPHPSHHLEKIQKFLLDWAKKTGIEAFQDDAGNIIYKKPAQGEGYENRRTVILQAHMDMVPQKTADSNHDFENDPILPRIEGDWVYATDTTLGADDGMGVAAIMAVMEDKTLKHGPLVALITSDEETGMYGAFGLKPGTIEGDILLNLDSETEGELYIGCAGGVDTTASMEYKPAAVEEGRIALSVKLRGLKGGHSGMEINQGRANANKLAARFMAKAANEGACIAEWVGGNMRNAIPRDVDIILTVDAAREDAIKQIAADCLKVWNDEFHVTENEIKLAIEKVETPATQVPQEISDNLIDAILACPNGVFRYIPTIPDTVETSSNMAIVEIKDGEAKAMFLTRSSCDTMKEYMAECIAATFRMVGMKVEFSGAYSGWEPDVDSPILAAMKEAYHKQFGKEAAQKVIHAGLECGVIGATVPGLDMISFGPTLNSPHTPQERCHIESVEKFYDFLTATLANTPEK